MRLILAIAALTTFLPAQEESLDSRVTEALEKARPVLLAQLSRATGGQLALLCLAAVHDEVPAQNEVFAEAIHRLSKAELQDTYELSIRLMVMAEYPEFPDRKAQAKSDIGRLMSNRVRGGFSYNQARARQWDLSNTQYGALGMRAAESLGFNFAKRIWRDLLRAVASGQSANGGFGYTVAGRSPYASMTVAGIVVMQICEQYLGRQVPTSLKVDARLAKAWQWMRRNVSEIGNPGARWSYYFHYGLERAAILSDVVRVADRDWYELGAEMLLEQQLANGGWGPDVRARAGRGRGRRARDGRAPGGRPARQAAADPTSTSFAVLFLRRKFQKVAIPITPGGGLRIGGLSDNSTEADIKKVADRELARGKAAVPDMLKAMRSDVLARRKVAARVLFRLSGKDFGFNPYRGAEQNQEAIKAAELWWLKFRGSR